MPECVHRVSITLADMADTLARNPMAVLKLPVVWLKGD